MNGLRGAGLLTLLVVISGCASDPPPPDTPTTEAERARAQQGITSIENLLAESQVEQASDLADIVIQQDPYAAETNIAYARAKAAYAVKYEDPRMYNEAVARAVFATEAKPDSAAVWFVKAKLEYDRHHYSRALVDLDRVLELEPTHHDALLVKAWCHRVSRQPMAEKKAWERLVEIHPDDARGTYRLGLLLLDGTPEEELRGRQLIEQAVQLDPSDDLALHTLARMRTDEKDHAGAEELLRRAVSAAAGRPVREADALFNLGACLQAQGKLEQAKDTYLRCLNIDLEHHRAQGNLGYVLVQTGDELEGARRLRLALDKETNRDVRDAIEKLLDTIEAGGELPKPDAEVGSGDIP